MSEKEMIENLLSESRSLISIIEEMRCIPESDYGRLLKKVSQTAGRICDVEVEFFKL